MLGSKFNLRAMLAASFMAIAGSAAQVAVDVIPTPRGRRPTFFGAIPGDPQTARRSGRGPSIAQARRAAKKARNKSRNRRAHRG